MSAAVTTTNSSQLTAGSNVIAGDPAAGDGAADGHAVQHSRRHDVVHIQGLAGDLGAPFLARDRASDLRAGHAAILAMPSPDLKVGLHECASLDEPGSVRVALLGSCSAHVFHRRQPIHTGVRRRAPVQGRYGGTARRDGAPRVPGICARRGHAERACSRSRRRSAERVHARVAEKLQREPVEDFRLDFEDGYGNRPDAEEDGHADRRPPKSRPARERGHAAAVRRHPDQEPRRRAARARAADDAVCSSIGC